MKERLLEVLGPPPCKARRSLVPQGFRPIALAMVCLLSLTLSAQEGELRIYRARVHQTATGLSPKSMIVAVSDWIPVIEIDVDREVRVLKFTTTEAISLAQLREHLVPTGYQAGGLECTMNSGLRTVEGVPPFPEFEDTGNDAVDYPRYDAAKAAWIAAYPDMYYQMTHPSHPVHGRK